MATISRAQQQASDPAGQSSCERGLLALPHSCGLRGGLLIKHTCRGHLQSFPETLAGGRYLHAVLLLHSSLPVFPRGELVCTSGALVLLLPLDSLGLVAREACIPRSHRIVAITEVVLAIPSTLHGQQTET